MTRLLSPARIAGALAGLVVATFVVLYLVPSNDYVLLPDTAHPVAPLVRVQGGHEPKGPGGVYFVRASDGTRVLHARVIVLP